LQLVDEAGRLWSLPGLRDWRWGRNPMPTNGWSPAEYAQTAYYVDLLPGTPPGRYTLQLSLFEKTTLTPLTFFADGAIRKGRIYLWERWSDRAAHGMAGGRRWRRSFR
jgi:hypothetical protein